VVAGTLVADVSVARGNVVLVDHGRTIPDEALPPVPGEGAYRPALSRGPVTQQGYVFDQNSRLVLFDPQAPAAAALRWDRRDVRPVVQLVEAGNETQPWRPQRDLLSSDRFATEFVVETEDNRQAFLRFGAPPLGRAPAGDLAATYRIGNGQSGNVGPEAIGHVVTDVDGIGAVRNLLPAAGGTEPESIDEVRLYAPQAFQSQARAVTEADYAAVAEQHPEVQKAAATRRWTGSWYTMFVTVDRRRGLPVDPAFEEDLSRYLERFRLAGYDVEIDGPIFVPLDVALRVCVSPEHFRANVKQALLQRFSTADLPGAPGTGRGFFHPDNFTFGQPVYLSQIVAAAMEVPGVTWVEVLRFQRWRERPRGEIEAGRIAFGRLEIARLDNDPNEPENGHIEFEMEGGL
jgi:predicted phage baseplate assembly protein